MNQHSDHPDGGSKKAGRAPSSRGDRESAAPKRQKPSDPQIRSNGAQRARWTAESRIPQIAPGTLDAAALLGSVTDTLRPVLEQRLAEMADSLATALADTQGPDAAAALRAELLRRVLPQFNEAVRGAVIEGIRTRQMHLAQLAVIDRTAHQADSLKSLRARIDHEITRAGLVRVTEPEDLALFDLVDADSLHQGSNEPPVYSVIAPAYTDRESGKPVERGWLTVAYERPALAEPALTPGRKRRQHADRPERQSQAQKKGAADPHSAGPRRTGHRKGTSPGRQPESAPTSPAGTAHLDGRDRSSPDSPKRSPRADAPWRRPGAERSAESVRGAQPVRGPEPTMDCEPARSPERVRGPEVTPAAEAGRGSRPAAAPGTTAPAPDSAGGDQPQQPDISDIDFRSSLRAAANKHRQGGSR